MYEEALSYLEEPAWIKVQLPIAYVAEKAGMRLTSGDGRLHAVCPFHEDTNPSFDIYPWGGGQRYGCFGCGAGGDVLDFIQRMWRLGFREACEMAKRGIAKMAEEGWKAPTLGAVFEWDEAAALSLLRRSSILETEVSPIIEAKQWIFPPSWLVGVWDCRSSGGQLLVPVKNEESTVVGLKHRRLTGSGSLISLPGSRLRTTLYGAQWLPLHQGPVLICEGESDAWTASWLLRGQDIAVLALPAGAGAAPCRLDLLEGRRVVIALDGDDAGRMSAARWADALGENASVLHLPDGQDITSVAAQDPTWLEGRMVSL